MVPLAKFDIPLKNTSPGLVPFCTESWQRFPTIFFSISLAPTDKVVSGHTKNYGKNGKLKEFTKNTEISAEERVPTPFIGDRPMQYFIRQLVFFAMLRTFHYP